MKNQPPRDDNMRFNSTRSPTVVYSRRCRCAIISAGVSGCASVGRRRIGGWPLGCRQTEVEQPDACGSASLPYSCASFSFFSNSLDPGVTWSCSALSLSSALLSSTSGTICSVPTWIGFVRLRRTDNTVIHGRSWICRKGEFWNKMEFFQFIAGSTILGKSAIRLKPGKSAISSIIMALLWYPMPTRCRWWYVAPRGPVLPSSWLWHQPSADFGSVLWLTWKRDRPCITYDLKTFSTSLRRHRYFFKCKENSNLIVGFIIWSYQRKNK